MSQSLNLTELSKRELLLLAAKSIGFVPYEFNGKFYPHYVDERDACADWDPMTDAGDAMKLAIELQLTVHNEHLGAGAAYCTRYNHDTQEARDFEVIYTIATGTILTKQDYRDTYRAIVYAAATLALEMDANEPTESQGN